MEGFQQAEHPKEQEAAALQICSREVVHHIKALKRTEVVKQSYQLELRKFLLGSMVGRTFYKNELEQQKVWVQMFQDMRQICKCRH